MPDTALNLTQILWDERRALQGQPLPSAEEPDGANQRIEELAKNFAELGAGDLPGTYRILNGDNRWALCLSGGGIRSAAFALGIVQCFAAHRVVSKRPPATTERVLQQFDYMSTVSGGGYVGSWLSAWLFQERKQRRVGDAGAAGGVGPDVPRGANLVLAQLNDRVGDHSEVGPIGNLRRNSHYLAPSASPISPDVWSDIATVVRNLILNWILLVPPMILAILWAMDSSTY
jgi:hypothetical protein